MLDILERIDPHSDRIDLLVELVDCLRPRRRQRGHARAAVRTLTQLLRGNPAQAWALRSYIVTLLEKRRHTSLYSDIGVLSNDGFFTELKRRIAWRLLPPALDDLYLSDALDQVLYAEEDHHWIRSVPNADWLALFDVVAEAPAPVRCRARPRAPCDDDGHAGRHPHPVLPHLRAGAGAAPGAQLQRNRGFRFALPDAEHRGQPLSRRVRPLPRRRAQPSRRSAPPAGDARPVRRRDRQDPPQFALLRHQRRADLCAGGDHAKHRAPAQTPVPGRQQRGGRRAAAGAAGHAGIRQRAAALGEPRTGRHAGRRGAAAPGQRAPRRGPGAGPGTGRSAQHQVPGARAVSRQYPPAGAQRHGKRQPHRRALHCRDRASSCAACSTRRPAPASSSASWRCSRFCCPTCAPRPWSRPSCSA